jgi:hypothetical protein
MKDNRKKYIEDNRPFFDDKEPDAGHFERFEALLEKQDEEKKQSKPARKVRLFSLISVAASVAILIAVSVKFLAPGSIDVLPTQENGGVKTEFEATNEYYNQQMQEQIADIMCKLAYTDTENQAQLTTDLQKLVDSNTAFVEEMKKSDNQEIAIHYLVKHYRTNIQVLENINEKLGKYTKC